MQITKISKIKKHQVEFQFQDAKDTPFDYVLEIKEGSQSQIMLYQKEQQSTMVLELEKEDHWDIFLRNELFLCFLALSSGVVIHHNVQYTKKQVDEILKGLELRLKWEKHFEYTLCELSKIIVFKQDLVMFKELLNRSKLDIISMAEIKREISFKYVKKLGVKMVTQSNFRTDIAGTIQRLKDIFKETSGQDRFKVKGNKNKFQQIQNEVRQAYVNSFSNSIDSQLQKQSKQVIVSLLQQKFNEIDTKMQKRQLNLTKFGVQIDHFINQIIQGQDNKQKVQILIGFLLDKVLKFFRLKPQQICWSGLPTVRQVISERSSRSRDYDDYFQQKQQLLKTISELKTKVQKYQKDIQVSKVSSKPSTPNIYNNPKSLNSSTKFTKSIASKIQKEKPKTIIKQKQKQPLSKINKVKTGCSSRASLSSTASLKNINKSSANISSTNISSVFQKNKKTAVGLQNPLPLLQMKMNKTVNSSAVTTPKTSSKPKLDSLKKSFQAKPSLRTAKIPSRFAK